MKFRFTGAVLRVLFIVLPAAVGGYGQLTVVEPTGSTTGNTFRDLRNRSAELEKIAALSQTIETLADKNSPGK